MVGCAMRTKMLTGRYLHGAHGAPYFDKTLNLLALGMPLKRRINSVSKNSGAYYSEACAIIRK